MGEGGIDHATILRPVKHRFFTFLLSLHHQNNHLENISIFLFVPLQLSSPPKKLCLRGKNFRRASAPHAPPKLRLRVTVLLLN